MVQCFVKRKRKNSFAENDALRLLYVCKTKEEQSVLPRAMHAHDDCLEIMLITGGEGTYTIGDRRYPVSRGDLLIYNQGVLHDEVSDPQIKMSSYCVGIDGVRILGLSENCLTQDGCCPVIKAGEHAGALESMFELIYTQLAEERDGAEELCHHLTRALIVRIVQLSKNSSVMPSDEHALAERIKKYIDRHYGEDISLKTISEQLNISQYYLAHVFKRATGYTTTQYIVRRRVGEAQSLLIGTNERVTRIAMMVGYDNPSYFNSIFTKSVGMSPRRYRECYTKKQNIETFKKD